MNAFDRAFIKAYTHDLEPSRQTGGQESGSADAAIGSGHLPTFAQDDALAIHQQYSPQDVEPVESAAPDVESVGPGGRVPTPHLKLLIEHHPILTPAELVVDSAIQAELAPTASRAEHQPPTQTIRLENREPSIPPRPHWNIASPDSNLQQPKDTQHGPLDGSLIADIASGNRSSFAPRQPAHGEDAPPSHSILSLSPAPDQGLHAQWEVDRFQWPMICDRLLREQAGQFPQVVERLIRAAGDGDNVIAMVGSTRGEGCTTITLCLAHELAARGVKVALVDADLDNPQLARRLAVEVQVGWENVLQGKQRLEDIAVNSIEDRLLLLPLRRPLDSASVANMRQRAAQCFFALATHSYLVLVDGGASLAGEQSLLAAGKHKTVDAALLVQNVRSTSHDQMQPLITKLHAAAIKPLGIAENFIGAGDGPGPQQNQSSIYATASC